MAWSWNRRVHPSLVVIAAASWASGLAGCESKKPADPTQAVFADFQKRLDEYAVLRTRLTVGDEKIDETKSQAEIAGRAQLLADSIVAARPQAKQGDLLTPEVASFIGTLIRQEYSRRSDSVIDVREDTQDELPDFTPQVNQLYPTTYPLATFPPTLLPLLPPLPKYLEYRIVSKYLVLRDTEANLIIDFMPHAVP